MNARHGTAVYPTQRLPFHKHTVWAPVLLTMLDRAVTVPFMQLEANPLVMQLGVMPWLGLTAGCLGSLVAVWYLSGLYRSRGCQAILAGLTALTAAAVTTNVWVVLG